MGADPLGEGLPDVLELLALHEREREKRMGKKEGEREGEGEGEGVTLMHCQPVGLYLQLRPGLLYRALHAASCPTCCIVPCMLHRALHAASGPTCCIGPYMLHRALHAASGPTGHLPIRRPCPPGPGPRCPAGAALALLAPLPWRRP